MPLSVRAYLVLLVSNTCPSHPLPDGWLVLFSIASKKLPLPAIKRGFCVKKIVGMSHGRNSLPAIGSSITVLLATNRIGRILT